MTYRKDSVVFKPGRIGHIEPKKKTGEIGHP